MTDAALLLPTMESFTLPGISESVGTGELPLGERGLFEPGAMLGAVEGEAIEETFDPAALAGAILTTFFDDFYQRVHLIPSSVDFGPIAATLRQTVVAWNAYLRPVTLTAVVSSTVEGVSIATPDLPFNFKALALRDFQVQATPDGPPDLDAEFEFQLDVLPDVEDEGDISLFLPVTGTRARLWPFLPNWREPYVVTYEFKSDVFTSRSGRESRRALRQEARKAIEFLVTARADALRAFNRLMATWQTRLIIVPEATRYAASVSPMAAEGDVMIFESVPAWVRPGLNVVLVYGDAVELRIVDSVDGVEVTFQTVSGTAWPTGTRMHPGLRAYAANDLQATRQTNAVAEMKVRFDVNPGSEDAVDPGNPSDTFNERELFLLRPNWSGGVDITHNLPVEDVDYGIGLVAKFYPVAYASRLFRATFVQRNEADVDSIRQFFWRMRGQVGEFYMPTWEDDLPLKVQSDAGTNIMRVAGTDVARAYAEDPVHKAIMVALNDGTRIFKTITDIRIVEDVDGTDTLIEIEDTWASNIDPADVLMICWVYVCRLASDAVTVQWLTDKVAQTQLSIVTLEAQEPEPITPT